MGSGAAGRPGHGGRSGRAGVGGGGESVKEKGACGKWWGEELDSRKGCSGEARGEGWV